MTGTVFEDAADGTIEGIGRFRMELYHYLASSGREDIRLIGAFRRRGRSGSHSMRSLWHSAHDGTCSFWD
jgi:hypothetical protein